MVIGLAIRPRAATNTTAAGDSQKALMTYRIVLIPGDGIGPEVTAATQRVVEAAGIQVEWQTPLAGQGALDKLGSPLPAEPLAAVQAAQATLKGPTATPSGKGFRSVNVELRQKLHL